MFLKGAVAFLTICGTLLAAPFFFKTSRAVADESQLRLGGETIEETLRLPHVQAKVRETRRMQLGVVLLVVAAWLGLLL